MNTEKAILAGGCFWGVEELIRNQPGVISTVVGYTGGDVPNATYRNHGTHAEGIEIVFDPAQLSYRALLEYFFMIHDPTTVNRQGNDRGTSYRSAIFYIGADQKRVTDAYVAQLGKAGVFPGPIVTQIVPLKKFYTAEAYHQDFVKLNPGHGYVVVNALPKLKKLKQQYPELVKK